MVQIIPSVLATSEDQYKNDITKLASCKALENGWVHIDFADNKFVQNQTIEPETVSKFPTNFRKEAHLMVTHPREWIYKLLEAEFERIIFHIEAQDSIEECIEYIKSKELAVGLAVNKDTAVEKLQPFAGKIDVILIMTIVSGFQGQPFIPEMLEKVRSIKNNNWSVRVGVDGAVKDENAKQIVDAGVDFMIVGSYLLKGNTDENLEKIREVINGQS